MTRHNFNLKDELRSPEVERFEKRYYESTGRQTALRDIPLKYFVDTTSALLQTKVLTTFIEGARDEAGFWQDLIRVVQLDSPVQKVPVISSRDFKVHKGKVPRTGNLQSGGKFTSVTLDTTNDDKIRYVYLQIDEQDVDLRNFNVIEQAIAKAGARFMKNILNDVTKAYDDVIGETQSLSTDKRFIAIAKLMANMSDKGFMPSRIIFEVNDWVKAFTEETTGGTMPWLSNVGLNGAPLGDNFGNAVFNGHVGRFMGRAEVYVISNEGGMGAGEIMVVDKDAAAVFGWAPNGAIRLDQEVTKMRDLLEAKIQGKYDIAAPSANTSAVGAVTGASA